MRSLSMYRPITEPIAPAPMMAHGFGFHLTMMKARIVHAGGANTGTVSTRRAATNAAKYSSTAVDYIGRVTYCEDTRSDHSTNRCRQSADARARCGDDDSVEQPDASSQCSSSGK